MDNPTVDALNALSIFGPRQAGAYREHAGGIKDALGPDIETEARNYVSRWAKSGDSGVLILTGNAGTGKTALVERYCEVLGVDTPMLDELAEPVAGCFVVKDFSGVTPEERRQILTLATEIRAKRKVQLFLCANEGVLRDAVRKATDTNFESQLNAALEEGVSLSDAQHGVSVINMNRQRWTAPRLWESLLDYLVRDEIWTECEDCPAEGQCPISTNATALRRPGPREAMRRLVQLASGTAVGTLRELLSILSHSITGGMSCKDVADRAATARPFTASTAYFNLVVGLGMERERIERSALLQSIQSSRLGLTADVEIDGWLRDPAPAEGKIRDLASPVEPTAHALVSTSLGALTFGELGETISVSDDNARVEVAIKDFSAGENALAMWRRRVFFEAQAEIGGPAGAFARLTRWTSFGDLQKLTEKLAEGGDCAEDRRMLITGLNYLSAGFHSYEGHLVVPEPGSLAARNPGAFYPPSPSLVHSQIRVEDVNLELEDGAALKSALDTDDIRMFLAAGAAGTSRAKLLLTPPLFEAVMDAARYRAPVGSDIPEMSELRTFYAELSAGEVTGGLQIVDPEQKVIRPVTLPTLAQ